MKGCGEQTIIRIEVCSNCQRHSWFTHHDEKVYQKLANDLMNAL